MPESYGKRQRGRSQAAKFAAREERRLKRKQRREDIAAGIIDESAPLDSEREGPPEEDAQDQAAAEPEAETPAEPGSEATE